MDQLKLQFKTELNEWLEMPEFNQEDLTSFRKIVVHFRNENDVKKFAEFIDQRITAKQPSLWFPFMDKRIASDKKYIDQDES